MPTNFLLPIQTAGGGCGFSARCPSDSAADIPPTQLYYQTAYTYDRADNLLSITCPSGRIVRYTRDDQGFVTDIETEFDAATVSIASGISRLPFGPVEEMTLGNDIVVHAGHDQAYRLTGLNAAGILNKAYTHDALGRVTAIADLLDPAGDRTFTYDGHSRLTVETGPHGTITYGHDRIGNRQTVDAAGNTTAYAYTPGTSRLRQYGDTVRSYDLSGRTTGSGEFSYQYNGLGRLSALDEKTGSGLFPLMHRDENDRNVPGPFIVLGHHRQTTYLYDGLGRRVESRVADQDQTRYHYHYDVNGQLLGITTYKKGVRTTDREFIRLDTVPVAQAETSYHEDGTVAASTLVFLHSDHLNTPVLATDASGTVVWQWDRTAFGNTTPDTDPDHDGRITDIPLRFPGQIAMPGDGGLLYNMHRYYDPQTGRYLTPDPIGLRGGMNLYVYVLNDPVNGVDPLGLSALAGALPLGGGLAAADGPLPVGDIIGGGIILGAGIYDAYQAWQYWNESNKGDETICPVDKNAEPNHPDFTPHKKKKGLQKIPWNKNSKGYPDKKGNYWEPVPDGHKGTHDPHWDVQHPDGSHTPKYP